MEKALTIQKQVQEILGTDQVFLVGGSVRDLVMGNTPKDYDFCTAMLPEEMIEKVKAAGRRVYTIGERFGTIGFKVKVGFDDKYKKPDKTFWGDLDYYNEAHSVYEYVEVTTFRSEVYTNKSRKPEVKFVPSLDEDLARRDFTMNAMVLRSDGTIHDPYGGKLDIYKKQIVTVGLPKDRIIEDPLRILRAARFAARYGFTIDPNFIGKARQLADRIYDVSVERWCQELDNLLTADSPSHGLRALQDMKLLVRILPELFFDYETAVLPLTFSKDPDEAWKKLLNGTGSRVVPKNYERLTKYINTGVCARLKFSNKRTDLILDKHKQKV